MAGLPEVESRVRELARRIGAPDHVLPTFGYSEDGARPHVEIDRDGLLHYVVVERGQESCRDTAPDLEVLLWYVFRNATFSMACDFELKNRVPLRDSRRTIFAKQVELLGLVSPEWAERKRREHEFTLMRYPFDDSAGERATLAASLRNAGESEANAWRRACETYPLPNPTVV
jgi:hypothetical protein